MAQERFKFSKNRDHKELFPPNMNYPYFEKIRHIELFQKEKEFSLADACFLAEASFLAYNHPSFIKYAFYYAGFDDFKMFIGKKVARCFAARKEDCLVVVFRGTEFKLPFAIPGFIADFKISMSLEKNGTLVHSGFQSVLDEIWEGEGMLHKYLLKQKKEKPLLKIYFAGHSLGGALSLISASRFPFADCVYTFGCPRVGNKEFANSVKTTVFRIVHNNDIVTELPPEKLMILKTKDEYSHVGELKFIDKKGKIKDKNGNKLALLKEFKGKNIMANSNIFKKFTINIVKTKASYFIDHSPYYYSTKLWNACVDSHVS